MNDEIKEILDRLDYNEWDVDLYKVPITWCELYDIRDYITNLQKEIHKQIHTSIVQKKQINNLQKRNSRQRLANQKQQDLILKLQDENQRLKEDKKKAVEYIKQHCYFDDGVREYMDVWEVEHLLNILQNGSENQ